MSGNRCGERKDTKFQASSAGSPGSESAESGLRLFYLAGVRTLDRPRSGELGLWTDFCGMTSNFDVEDADCPTDRAGRNPVDPGTSTRLALFSLLGTGLVRARPLLDTACRAPRPRAMAGGPGQGGLRLEPALPPALQTYGAMFRSGGRLSKAPKLYFPSLCPKNLQPPHLPTTGRTPASHPIVFLVTRAQYSHPLSTG